MSSSRRLLDITCLIAAAAVGSAHYAGAAELSRVPSGIVAREPAGAPAATVWTYSDAAKILPGTKPVATNRTIAAAGARGESVAYQIVVSATKGLLSAVNVAFGDLSDGRGHTLPAASGIQLYREFYLDLTQPSGEYGHTGEWPDGLVPIGKDPYYREQRNGAPFAVAAGKNQAVWVDFNIPAGTSPGVYTGSARVTDGSTLLATVPVSLTVWNFTLPATSSLTTAFGFNTYQAYLGYYTQWNTNSIVTLSNLYQAEALRHRISLYENDVETPQYAYNASTHQITNVDYTLFDATYVPDLDGSLLPDRAEATVAQVPDDNATAPGPTPGPNDAQAVAFWKLMGQYYKQKGWLSRNFYYDVDEPQTAQDFETAAHRADLVHQADPSLHVMETTTIHNELIGKIDIWDPIVNELDSPGFPPPSAYAARQKAGDKVWFYTSNNSLDGGGPWPSFFVDADMNSARIFTWMAWRYHLDGFLYYGTVEGYGNPNVNPWTNVYNFGDNGDGLLFYPGTTSMIGGRHPIPCDSIRLKEVRAALQDYEYMMLLHKRGQDAFVDSLVQKIAVKTNYWSQDGNAILEARAEMAKKILGN